MTMPTFYPYLRACPFVLDEEISPLLRGKLDYARGFALDESPYDEPANIADWQRGWSLARERMIGSRLIA